MFWLSQRTPQSPDSPDTTTAWMCEACDAVVQLTALEASREEQRAGGIPLICGKCGEKHVYRVASCQLCGSYYFSSDVPNSPGRCLICFPPKREELDPEPEPIIEDDGTRLPPAV